MPLMIHLCIWKMHHRLQVVFLGTWASKLRLVWFRSSQQPREWIRPSATAGLLITLPIAGWRGQIKAHGLAGLGDSMQRRICCCIASDRLSH
jgi:hypothetical protein